MWHWALSQAIGSRQEQQDRVGVCAKADGALVLVIADGVGGHRHGAAAAELVITTVQSAWERLAPNAAINEQWLSQCLASAASQIMVLDTQLGGAPRTTATVLAIDDSVGFWSHIGDTRLYQWYDQTLRLCTRDDSVARMLIDMGELSEAELPNHPDRSLLTRTLGEQADPKLRTGKIDFSINDGVVLCSDGLWEQVTVTEMSNALATPILQTAADHLVALATHRAGNHSDNVSVILARKINH